MGIQMMIHQLHQVSPPIPSYTGTGFSESRLLSPLQLVQVRGHLAHAPLAAQLNGGSSLWRLLMILCEIQLYFAVYF